MTTTTPITTRLHITPLTPDILPSVLPASIRPSATEISFHTIPTFPENNYGYVTLPTMEAEKIKKKLNGSILKGKKFKIEIARPEKKRRKEEDEEVEKKVKPEQEKSEKKSKKRKAEAVVDGFELPDDRKVKRGWTESSSSKKERRKEEKQKKEKKEEKKAKAQAKSKYTEKEECLFRTKLPANRSSAEEKESKKKKKKPANEAVVHEFAKTFTQPSFLRSEGDGAPPTSNYEEGKGWVDSTGNVKEPSSDKVRKEQFMPGKVIGAKEKRKAQTSSPEKESKSLKKSKKAKSPEPESEESEDWTSSSGSDDSSDSEDEPQKDSKSSSDDESDASSSEDEQPSKTKETEKPDSKPAFPEPAAPAPAEKETATEPQPAKEVHPLEALYKRPAPTSDQPVEAPSAFSFFGQDDDIESEEEAPAKAPEPATPFTKKDNQSRGLRSAAPTPDTALAGRHINWNESDEDAMDVDEQTDSPVTKPGEQDESDFTKWFWENRGDNNRAWKKRRRDAAKEQRQSENRRRGMKGKS